MNTTAQITATITPMHQTVAARYTATTTATYTDLTARYGTGNDLTGLGSKWGYDGDLYRSISNHLTNTGTHPVRNYVIDTPRLARAADAYATATIDALIAKLAAKLEGVTVTAMAADPAAFTATVEGTVNGHAVRLVQKLVVNCSSRGKFFAQFPAVISIDGKKSSAAALTRLAA